MASDRSASCVHIAVMRTPVIRSATLPGSARSRRWRVGSITAPSTDVVEIDAFFRDAELGNDVAPDEESGTLEGPFSGLPGPFPRFRCREYSGVR